MEVHASEVVEVRTPEDVTVARQCTRRLAVKLGLTLLDQTKVVTASSELARNLVIYGGGGVVTVQVIANGVKSGLRLTFEDQGPGIPDVELALKDGYTTGNGLGLGLGGAKRLSHEFEIDTKPGAGTRITIIRWKA